MLNLVEKPNLKSSWKSCWTACVCWKTASENRGEGKSADWLSSVHCCSDWLCQASRWGPWSRWSVLRGALSPLHPPPQPSLAHKHARHQHLPPWMVLSPLHQSRASLGYGHTDATNEHHLFFSSMAIDANHNTHFIWFKPLSQSQNIIQQQLSHERHRQKDRFYRRGTTLPENDFSQHKCNSKCALHHCITGKKYFAVKKLSIALRNDCLVGKLWKRTHFVVFGACFCFFKADVIDYIVYIETSVGYLPS